MQLITILGATGSIGKSTLSVIEQNADKFSVFALTANQNVELLFDQCCQFKPRFAVVADESGAETLRDRLTTAKVEVEVLVGRAALSDVASASEVHMVMAAIVGGAGLEPTLAAVKAGKRVLLANKESLVMSGRLFTEAVEHHNAQLLPIDSEHNAIFQCLPDNFSSLQAAGISKILLTGSGGPFRTTPLEDLAKVTPEQACAHPNWSMGQKISVDSATMMNKGLEFIEACWLFHASPENIQVVVHPQSIVHSMVQYRDGSILAQMGQPDMRTPIAHCMAWPGRITAGAAPLDFTQIASLTFEAPDYNRFPCLKLAVDVMSKGEDYAVALNAANEIAVAKFLRGELGYIHIASVIQDVIENWRSSEPESIDAVIEADLRARDEAEHLSRQYL